MHAHQPFRRRSVVALVVGGLTLLAALVAPSPASAAVPSSWVTEQVDFIVDNQLPDGAILSTPTQINPYFANIAAMGLARANTATSRAALRAWMGWYLDHLNDPDASGLVDTVYDYTYDGSTETPTNDYDSVDSYASTTLNVAYLAYETGDDTLRQFVADHIVTYEGIANLLNYPQDSGGVRDSNDLTFAKPTYHADYLMDNAEVYSGLNDFAALESTMGRASQASYYASWATTTQNAITSLLWNSSTSTWDWALGSPATMATFYPDSVAQLWPTIEGVVAPTDGKATTSWDNFTTAWPDWKHDTEPDSYPWTAMASAAERMGDSADADTLLTSIHDNYAPGWAAPTSCGTPPCGSWYDAEAGWFLLGAVDPGNGSAHLRHPGRHGNGGHHGHHGRHAGSAHRR